ncbi:hypothetical protein AMTR_s00147p00093130 [Amborella trichopoda]|uniref:Mono-/di-acylglycerol lipase N-terminal domain-containing protein n=1 Tax=Amborella trichopoda TaxID=13333 RepID=W1P8Y2_AMBTC|nr:hypothetical protein AMTR_s00147p00093130 [Amborella trichopoda]
MATATMATAAGAAALLYYTLSRRLATASMREDNEDENSDASRSNRSGRITSVRRPAQAPATWFEAISTLSETLRFTYSETLGKWPIGDLAFGITFLLRRQTRDGHPNLSPWPIRVKNRGNSELESLFPKFYFTVSKYSSLTWAWVTHFDLTKCLLQVKLLGECRIVPAAKVYLLCF